MTERDRFEYALTFAWVLWHAGLTASSVFLTLGVLLRREDDARRREGSRR